MSSIGICCVIYNSLQLSNASQIKINPLTTMTAHQPNQRNRSNHSLKSLLSGMAFLLVCTVTTTIQAQKNTWTIDGQQFEAQLIDFNGKEVLLQDSDQQREAISLERLSKKDVAYVRSQVKQLKLKLNSDRVFRGIEIWRVDMRARSGETFYRNYSAANSDEAMEMAQNEFRGVHVQSISKQTGKKRVFRVNRRQNNRLKNRQKQSTKRQAKTNKSNKAKGGKSKGK